LLDQKGTDLIDGRRSPRDQAGANPMQGRFVLGSDELIHLMGAHTAAGFGRPGARRSNWSCVFSRTTRRFGRRAASATASASL
jgi:hypothetical protein